MMIKQDLDIVARSIHELEDLSNLIQSIDEQAYTTKIRHLQESTIGQHVRHVIELFEELIIGYQKGVVNYEKRQRKMVLEQFRDEAVLSIKGLTFALNIRNKELFLDVAYIHKNEVQSNRCITNFFRELIFNIEHSVHHKALIKAALIEMGLADKVNAEFGYADSTILANKQAVKQ
ncbi:MAG: hypothetical protein ACI8ZN_001821 [Bacteroidia bacterium]|jgi:hypothetical protein